jgi:long-chain acyl-CoA synthetase
MSNLWDLSSIQPETRVVLDGDTIPAMFWNGVAKRGDQVWMRQKQLGIWRSWRWASSRTTPPPSCPTP